MPYLTNYLIAVIFAWLSSALAFGETLTFVKQNSPPKYLENQQGLCDQIYQALATLLTPVGINIEVDPAYYPAKRLLQMVETGEAQGFCGAEKNSQRMSQFGFADPSIYSVSYVLLAHTSENFLPASIDEIIQQNIVVGSFYGTNSSQWLLLNKDLPQQTRWHIDKALSALSESGELAEIQSMFFTK